MLTANKGVQYRPEVDGLRAFAIIPVILFHLGYEWITGGYVGVDVFFVISGYLITSILLKTIQANQFSYKEFFMRRVRRLMPMATVIYSFCLLVFSFIYPPQMFDGVAMATLSSLTFVSNIFFWQQGGYFGPNLESNPLLHTWSLSVEEQFYLLFPIFLSVLYVLGKSRSLMLYGIGFVVLSSLAIAVVFAPNEQSYAAFYLLPPRMYELALGSLVAYLGLYYPNARLRQAPMLMELGLVFILAATFMFDRDTTFPSYNALLPVLGTCLVLLSARTSCVAYKVLASKPLVWVGLISYSLYLWHWPLVVLKNWVYPDAGIMVDGLFIGLMFVLSWSSYKYIESPFRRAGFFSTRKVAFLGVGTATVIGASSIWFINYTNQMIVDPSHSITKAYSRAIKPEPQRVGCTNRMKADYKFHSCTLESSNPNAKHILVWGDSHGSALMPVFERLQDKYTVTYVNNTGCPPLLDVERKGQLYSCGALNELVFEHIENQHYELTLLVGAYNNYLNWQLLRSVDRGTDALTSLDVFRKGVDSTTEKLQALGVKYAFFQQPPRFPTNVPEEFSRVMILGASKEKLSVDRKTYDFQSRDFLSVIDGKHPLLQLAERFCEGGACHAMDSEYIRYKDQHHVSNSFARSLAGSIDIKVNEILGSSGGYSG